MKLNNMELRALAMIIFTTICNYVYCDYMLCHQVLEVILMYLHYNLGAFYVYRK